MNNLPVLEKCYKEYIKDLKSWLPEGMIHVNLELLHRFNLLQFHRADSHDPALTRYFHVLESEEKITLVNDQYVIWIVPYRLNNVALTYTLIALNVPDHPKLEMAFVASGVYNTSRLVLRVLEKFLFEIQENEDTLKAFHD